jgi:putative spermidine/putrescine transport system permease protein
MKAQRKLKNSIHLLPALPFFLLVIFFLLIPFVNTVIEGFTAPDTGTFTVANFKTVFTKPVYYMAVWNSVRIAVYGTVAGIIISFFTALAVTTIGSSARARFMPILNMTQNFTGFPLAFAFMLMQGHSGFLRLAAEERGWEFLASYNLYTGNGMTPLFIYFAIPLGTLLLIPGFNAVREEWKESATLMGANGFQFWTQVGLPNLAPTLFGTIGILFADSITTYTTVYMIMGENYATLPIKIGSMFSGDSKQQTELGSALSLTMIAIILLVMGFSNYMKRRVAKGGEQQ